MSDTERLAAIERLHHEVEVPWGGSTTWGSDGSVRSTVTTARACSCNRNPEMPCQTLRLLRHDR